MSGRARRRVELALAPEVLVKELGQLLLRLLLGLPGLGLVLRQGGVSHVENDSVNMGTPVPPIRVRNGFF